MLLSRRAVSIAATALLGSTLVLVPTVAPAYGSGHVPAAGAATATVSSSGTLTLTTDTPTLGQALSFHYSTDAASVPAKDDNWIGIYDDPADGPVDQVYSGHGSTAYQYVHGTAGDVTFSAARLSGLTAGTKSAYFLYDDGYTWLAQPLSFDMAGTTSEPGDEGSLTLTSSGRTSGDDLTFHYETSTPNALNWVGLYADPSSGPTDQTYHRPSSTYKYVSGTSGDVTISSASLGAGTHAAYFLYNDGYTWLAQPILFTLTDPVIPPKPTFLVATMWAGYVKAGATAAQSVAGLWNGSDGTFAKAGGDAWLSVSADGTVTATAPRRVPRHPGSIEVSATDPAGDTATITVEYAVYRTTVPRLKTASWNLWDAGRHVADGTNKELAAILDDRLDVVGLQQTDGTAAAALARRLGWFSYQSDDDLGILSRYPLSHVVAPTATLPAASVTAAVGGRDVTVWTADLDPAGYGPYAVCLSGATRAAAVSAERSSRRYRQAQALTTAMRADLAKASARPVVLLGDLSSPSSLDWTKRTSARHCDAGRVDWPVTDLIAGAGLRDSFRVANPNPVTDAGDTWSPLVGTHATANVAEPHDRVDYVDYAGRLGVVESHALITGFPARISGSITDPAVPANTPITADPTLAGASWPSDHAAAVTTFVLH